MGVAFRLPWKLSHGHFHEGSESICQGEWEIGHICVARTDGRLAVDELRREVVSLAIHS